MYTDPSVLDFQEYFVRDFPYGNDSTQNVLDGDIERALSDAKINLNPANCGSQEMYTKLFLLLAAHFLCINIRNSSQGLSSSFDWAANSKSVGSVSTGISIPQRILDNPEFAYLTVTGYGAQYLMTILPLLSGQMYSVRGGTHP